MAKILAGGRRNAKLGTTPSGKTVWLEKLPSEYKGWSSNDHLYAAILHEANRTPGGRAEIHRARAGKIATYSPISDSAKIRDAVARFPSTFGLRGFPGDVFRISPTSSYVSGGGVMLYTQRRDDGHWLDFSKGTEAELRREVVPLTSIGSRAHSTIAGRALRDYEYVIYPEATHRHAERALKIPSRPGKGLFDLTDAKLAAKKMGPPAAIYSVSKGRFVGYIHPNGRYIAFR